MFIRRGLWPASFGQNGPWWFPFHQTPDLPEVLVQGKEREYLSWFYKGLAYNPEAITQNEIDEFVKKYPAPCAMRAGFEYYSALHVDAMQNKEIINESKLQMPVLVLALYLSHIWPRRTWQSNIKFNKAIRGECQWHSRSVVRSLDPTRTAKIWRRPAT